MKHAHLRLFVAVAIIASVISGASMANEPLTVVDSAVQHWHDMDDGVLVALRDGYSWTRHCTCGTWFFAAPVKQSAVDARLATITVCDPVPLRDVESR